MNPLFTPLSGLLKISAQASVLIVLVLAAQGLCGRSLQPRWRCALWVLVLLRLALPWTVPSPASVFNLFKLPTVSRIAPPEPAGWAGLEPPAPGDTPAAAPLPNTERPWLAWIWLAGALGTAGCAGLSHYRIHRRVARQRPLISETTLGLLEDCKALMGISAPVTLIETRAIESPTLFGFVRPRLLLPAGLASTFTREELRHVFLHELAHIKRGDVFAGWVMLGLQIVHWFNPLVWLAFNRLRADRELACDALALSRARPGENEAYGLTIVKLLERFSHSVWAPSLAGILEDKQQIRERINMIARFHHSNRGSALAVALFAGLALITFTDAQQQAIAVATEPNGGDEWNLQERLQEAQAGNQWAAYDLWDAYHRGKHGIQPDPAQAEKWLGEVTKDLWVVRFEPLSGFAPASPSEFLDRINKYSRARSGQSKIGAASFFRTTKQGDKLVGSFLSNYPDQLKASLAKVPGIKVTSAERITARQFIEYEQSPQESIWDLKAKVKQAQGGDQWAMYDLWDTYYRGKHGVARDAAQADKWLGELVQNVWVVRFEPVGDFAPANPGEFLGRINENSPCRSGRTTIGAASFFRTTKKGDKLVGSFLSTTPDVLKDSLANVPGLKVISSERVTPKQFIEYEQSRQESL